MRRFATILGAVLLTASLGLAAAQDLGGRTLVVGSDTTYPPFETVNEAGEIVGFDIDVLTAICERVNCTVEFQTTAWDGIFPALANGEFDVVASGVTITDERDEVVDFTDSYFSVDQAVAVRVEDEGLTLDDFIDGDLIFGAQQGTTNAIVAEDLVGRDRVQLYDDFNAAILALINGDVDGVLIDDVVADEFVQQYAGEIAVGIRAVESGDKLGFAVQEGDALIDALNAGLQMIIDDGTLDELKDKWF
ncbi:MAG TPA: basic amino acid ABC transporter substrate-binding protein [Trueperaceae bacterium]|nr:basic amino acid ABC transporter substrate-binding protein [Trueperaceae bacterium]